MEPSLSSESGCVLTPPVRRAFAPRQQTPINKCLDLEYEVHIEKPEKKLLTERHEALGYANPAPTHVRDCF